MSGGTPSVEVFLNPGEHFVGHQLYRVRTLLGSCVSIVLWHRAFKVGAMSHFLLAARQRNHGRGLDGRYGEEALEIMVQRLSQLGVDPRQCEAKLFGGSDMFQRTGPGGSLDIGRKNGQEARRLVQLRRIPIVAESLFGVGHRRIVFDIATGDVWSHQATPSPGEEGT